MRRGQPGFTLVELLVAIAVMALLAIVSWRGLDGMVRAQQITRERADAVLELQTVLAQWGADLDALMPSSTPSPWPGMARRCA
jgi:general secretion pathway protein J